MKKVKLYVKYHPISNIQYFGKTIQENVKRYRGSGTRWNNILEKYGHNNVQTMIVGEFDEDDPCLVDFALGFSAANDIVNSEWWANLTIETGLDGSYYFTEDALERIKKGAHKGNEVLKEKMKNDKEFNLMCRLKNANGNYRRYENENNKIYWKQSDEAIKKQKKSFKEINHQQGEKNSQHGKVWIHNDEMKLTLTVKKPVLDCWLNRGWKTGRKMKYKGKQTKRNWKQIQNQINLQMELMKIQLEKEGFLNKN